jgi:MATE family multidrug resistance protein
MATTSLVLWSAPRAIIGLFLDLAAPTNATTAAIAVPLLLIAAVFQVFDGMQTVAAGALRGLHDATLPMLLGAIGYWAVGFAGGWLLAFPLGLGPIGLWSGLALGLATVALLLAGRFAWLSARLQPA